jgi:hypothetical protein
MAFIHAGLRNVPQSTFDFAATFVNGFSRVSTGFYGFSSALVPKSARLAEKPAFTP